MNAASFAKVALALRRHLGIALSVTNSGLQMARIERVLTGFNKVAYQT